MKVKLRYLEMHWHSIGKISSRPGREGGHPGPPLHLHGLGLLPVLLQQAAPAVTLGNQPGKHQQGVEVFNSDSSRSLSHWNIITDSWLVKQVTWRIATKSPWTAFIMSSVRLKVASLHMLLCHIFYQKEDEKPVYFHWPALSEESSKLGEKGSCEVRTNLQYKWPYLKGV